MAIRFHCPSCKQPIEIDNEWAGQSVACPYCQKVVTAPQNDELAGGVQTAQPGAGLNPPPPPQGMATAYAPAKPGSTMAVVSLLMVLAAGACFVFGLMQFGMAIQQHMQNNIDPNLTPEQMQKQLEDDVQQGKISVPSSAGTAAWLGTALALGGLIVSILSLVRGESMKWMAIIALLIGLLFMLCNFGMGMGILALTGQMPTTVPAGAIPSN